jgi:hypothetical protein
MAADATQVVAGRNIIVYTEPYNAANAFPSNAIVWGTTWGGAWTDKGFTRDGLHVRMNVQRQPIQVDQQVDPILRIPTQRDLEMQTRLAQISMQNLSDSTGQGTVTASGSNFDYVVSGTIVDQFITTGFDILNPGDLQPIRVVGWRGFVQGDVQLDFNVTDAAQIQFSVAIVPDTGTVPARIMTFRDINP